MSFWRKKQKPQLEQTLSSNLRRRFHHLLISKRKTQPKASLPRERPRKMFKRPSSPFILGLKKISLGVAAAGIFLGLLYTIFFSSFFSVSRVMLEKTGSAVDASKLQPFLDKLKSRNILFLNSDKLTREVEQAFKNEILIAHIKKSYPRRVTVKIEEYPPVVNLHVLAAEKTQKFVLNQIGYSIAGNTEYKELPTLILKTAKPFNAPGTIIEKERLDVMTDAFKTFETLFAMKAPSGEWEKTERELHLKTEKGFFVWLDLTQDIDGQLSKLKRALRELDIYNERLDYIDLRIAGGDNEKIIFKRK